MNQTLTNKLSGCNIIDIIVNLCYKSILQYQIILFITVAIICFWPH